ncbi:MAG: hypothetical protein ACYC26_01655 [Phycisphaerales bacterium]
MTVPSPMSDGASDGSLFEAISPQVANCTTSFQIEMDTHRTLNPRTAAAFRRPNGKPMGREGAKRDLSFKLK